MLCDEYPDFGALSPATIGGSPIRLHLYVDDSDAFVAKAIENELLIIPGNIFSHQDTHFRVSYAADDATIDRGIEVLKKLARGR